MLTSIRPPVTSWQSWQGGWIESIDDPASVRLQAGPHQIVLAVPLALVPGDARSLHCPVAVQVTGDDPSVWTVVTIVGSSFAAGDALTAQRGTFRAAIVPRAVTRAPKLWWTASAPRHSFNPPGRARDGEMPSDEPWSF